jgi:hypothetical protein
MARIKDSDHPALKGVDPKLRQDYSLTFSELNLGSGKLVEVIYCDHNNNYCRHAAFRVTSSGSLALVSAEYGQHLLHLSSQLYCGDESTT